MGEIKTGNGLYIKVIKRPMDFMLSLSALLILSPLMAVTAILIKIDSEGPVFFIQERLGRDLNIFRIYKFRTMEKDAVRFQKVKEEVTDSDSRITSLGRFLRRSKLDELPQLINILKGDMSIVGPRPTLPEFKDIYEDWELEKFSERPGLTGLAQINGNIYLERIEKSRYDVKYVRNITFLSDMKIILKTVQIVIWGEDKFIKRDESKTDKEASADEEHSIHRLSYFK